MKALLQAPAGKPAQTHAADPAPHGPAKAQALCPECLQPFPRIQPGQLFCSPAHRDGWNNRQTVRGRILTPLTIVARVTRGGSRGDTATGAKARRQQEALIQRWVNEDRAAGRMDWPAYMRLRYASGFDPLG